MELYPLDSLVGLYNLSFTFVSQTQPGSRSEDGCREVLRPCIRKHKGDTAGPTTLTPTSLPTTIRGRTGRSGGTGVTSVRDHNCVERKGWGSPCL